MICTKDEKRGHSVELNGNLKEIKADLAAIGRAIKATCDVNKEIDMDGLIEMVRKGTKMTDEDVCRLYIEADPRWDIAQKIFEDEDLLKDFLGFVQRFKEGKHERED